MSETVSPRITPDDIQEVSPDTLETWVRESGGEIQLEVPLANVGFTQDPGDIASDYVDAIFVGETLAPMCDSITNTRIANLASASIQFSIRTCEVSAICREIHRLLSCLYVDGDYEEFGDAYADIEEQLYWQNPKSPLRFPDLADDYMANLLHGSAPWELEEHVHEYQRRFPETVYSFWRSFASPRLGYSLYCSSRAWIAPPDVDVVNALATYGFWNKEVSISLAPATMMAVPGMPSILMNDMAVVQVPGDDIGSAVECSEAIQPFGPTGQSLDQQWLLSTTGDVTVFRTARAQHIAFCDPLRLGADLAETYLSRSESAVQTLRRALGIEIHTPCEWETLDDEEFERLCYDVACRCGQFDPGRIRKMGKARSRDGGRDLVAFTKTRPGHTPKKWIIQCKLLSHGRSLSGSMVQVSDSVDQYGAMGFAVMTNAVIDATLFDKLDSICERRDIEQETWSGMELERFLQGHRDLLSRYFRKVLEEGEPDR